MAPAAHDRRQCTRCKEWKPISCFPADAALLESKHVCPLAVAFQQQLEPKAFNLDRGAAQAIKGAQ
jgi:hypothetical protein